MLVFVITLFIYVIMFDLKIQNTTCYDLVLTCYKICKHSEPELTESILIFSVVT